MANGALITADYQYEFRDLLIGSGTNFVVEKVEGLLGPPVVNSTDADRAYQHGGIMGRHTMQRRIINMTFRSKAAVGSTIETRIDQVLAAFSPSSLRTEYGLYFQRPGHGKRFVNARVLRAPQPVSNYELGRGSAEFITQLVATDPRVYALPQLSQVITVAAGATSNSAAVANTTQTWDELDQFQGSPPVISIVGPAVNPRFANLQNANRSIKTTVNLGAGQTMVIDVGARTVTVAGVLNYAVIPDDNQWWEMLKGTNNITVSRTGTTGSPVTTITWYPAHMR